MIDSSWKQLEKLAGSLLGLALMAGAASEARAGVLAYEGFNYTVGAKLLDANNDATFDDGLGATGGGWATGWDNLQGVSPNVTPDDSTIGAGSLTYTDAFGNSLTTSGGKLLNTGSSANNSQAGRPLSVRRDGAALGATATTSVPTWIAFLALRTGTKNDDSATLVRNNTYGRGANLSLFDSTLASAANEEKINFGENSNFQAPITTGSDFLRLQQTDPTQLALWQTKFGHTSALAQTGYDMWMVAAPKVSASITAQAAPGIVDPQDGTITAAVDWHVNPINGRMQSAMTTVPFGTRTDLMVARIDQYGGDAPRDKVTMWVNPNLNATPSDASAAAVLDLAALEARGLAQTSPITPAFTTTTGNVFSFDRLRLFAGNDSLPAHFASWSVDEIRFGESFGDVTPHGGGLAAVPEPASLTLAAAAFAAACGWRRRK